MKLDNIVISSESFASDDKYDIIYSNISYIDKLTQKKIDPEIISDDALKSYFVDCYLAQIKNGSFSVFIYSFYHKKELVKYIREGLEEINAVENLKLFNQAIESRHQNNFQNLDKKFRKLQKKENLIELNHLWLINHPKLLIIKESEFESSILSLKKESKEEPKYIRTIKKLCKIAKEEYLKITAGDPNNIYNKSWYFQTVSGYFYMIEKDGKATMFNSYTKEEVASIVTQSNLVKPPILNRVIAKLSIGTLYPSM
jgi:hypothetical protein